MQPNIFSLSVGTFCCMKGFVWYGNKMAEWIILKGHYTFFFGTPPVGVSKTLWQILFIFTDCLIFIRLKLARKSVEIFSVVLSYCNKKQNCTWIHFLQKEGFFCCPAGMHPLLLSSVNHRGWRPIRSSWRVSRSCCNLITGNLWAHTSRLCENSLGLNSSNSLFDFGANKKLMAGHPSLPVQPLHDKATNCLWIARCG